MASTAHQRSLLSRISIRRNQVVSMENNHDQEQSVHELFQKTVGDRLAGLIPSGEDTPSDAVLSIAWFRKLLDVFLCCEAEFKMVILTGHDPAQLNKPPLDRLMCEYTERVVKALDVCNAVTNAIDLVRQWQKLAEIAVAALEQRPIGEGQIRRAKKALINLLICMSMDDKDSQTAMSAERSWSFSRRGSAAPPRVLSNFRSFSVAAKSWSSAKQIQSMTANLVAPRGSEAAGSPVCIMSTVMVFTMWALVAAFPCQERNGVVAHFSVAKQLGWAQPIIFVQEKVGVLGEELKKEKRGSGGGMLEETQRMEKLVTCLLEFAEGYNFPADEVAELAKICGKMEEGLGGLQQQVREVFHRIARSRREVLELVNQIARKLMANSLSIKHGLSLWCPQSVSTNPVSRPASLPLSTSRRSFVVSSASFANENREFVIVGGGNAAGYAARTFVEHGMANGKLCIVSKEAYAPYERPALTKAYLFPHHKNPARLPGFHTCVGAGGERQTPDWYKDQGIEMLYEDPVTGIDIKRQTLTTNAGKILKYGSLIISTGCTASRFPEKIGGNLPGVHYIRDVSDADSLISSLGKARKVVVVGGGYIGMEVAAAAVSWNLDTTVVFPETHLLPRLFTPSLAHRYEELFQNNGVKFVKGVSIKTLEAGSDGRVTAVKLENGSIIEADTIVIGIGAKPAVSPFESLDLNTSVGGIQVDGQFRTSVPGIFAIGDVAAFPLKMYDRIARVEHVDHARRSAQHCIKSLLTAQTQNYDYLPYFYSRIFEYEGTSRKVWWQFFGENVGEVVEVGNFNPKIATFWLDSGKLKGVLLESGSAEEFQLLPILARNQPSVDKVKLQNASSVEDALEIARAALPA